MSLGAGRLAARIRRCTRMQQRPQNHLADTFGLTGGHPGLR
ncbi:hypothetical protein FDG2_0369 [Candidatus Protofrankia californiensis]|uniref:Uncharacterized protein n=1 Tax=Candidatus Protofrankia californiensis TaxID=1839754 RepID=A0A1C3NTG0_9ACTN|nr:hypothetical protein FDG2_0369 [Candidatus Protofrankia californiensis]